MRSLKYKAFALLALLTVLRASNSPEITDVFVDPYKNGLLFTLYSEETIDIDNVSSWMSPHGWYYITVNGAIFSLSIPGKIPARQQIKDIVIKNNHESGQIALLVKKPFHSIQILKSEISNAVQVSAVYEVSNAIKQRLGDALVEKEKDTRFEERTRPLARKKAQNVANRSPSIIHMNIGFNKDTLDLAVDEMLDAILFEMADIDDFTNSKKIENETEFIRMNEGRQHRINDPNIMNDLVKLGDVAAKGPSSSSVKELFIPKRNWFKDDFFVPKDEPQKKGRLKITSTIDDVTVFIDDEYVGLTPISDNIELTVGSHKVWCIPPVPVNDSRWYEAPISENVIGDVIHNVIVRANATTVVDFDLYILNTAPNYKEKVYYLDSLGTIIDPEDDSRYVDLKMDRFINKRITSHKNSAIKRADVPPLVKEVKSTKKKAAMNVPPPLAVSDLRKPTKDPMGILQDKTDLSKSTLTKDDREVRLVVRESKSEDTSGNGTVDIAVPDSDEKTSNDSDDNLFSRLFSSLKNNRNNGSKREQPDKQDLQINEPVEEEMEQIETDIEKGELAAADVDKKTAKSNRNIFQRVFPPKNSTAKRKQEPLRRSTMRSTDLDVIRIVNAEYVESKKRRPVNIDTGFPSTNHRVYCFTVVQNMATPVNISHYWYRNGEFMARVPMKIGFSSSWRCWSYITLRSGFEGNWKVVVRGPSNQELEEINFSIFPDKNLAKQK